MKADIIRSGKNNPCPVCDRIKDSDRSWFSDGKTVMCHSFVDGTGHDESKWHHNGVNKNPIWSNFVLKEGREFVKPNRPKGSTEYDYPNRDGSPLVKITRIDDGNGNKKFPQSHRDGSKWVMNNPSHIKPLMPIYRYKEVRDAIDRGDQIFVVEGEGIADLFWEMGIAATTTVGGSGGYASYGADYANDLKGARLVLAPDKDSIGLKYVTYKKDDKDDDDEDEGDGDGEKKPSSKSVGNQIEAIAYCQNPEGGGTGILIEFRNQREKVSRVLIPRGTLTGDGSEALRFLAELGYHYHRRQKQLLLDL